MASMRCSTVLLLLALALALCLNVAVAQEDRSPTSGLTSSELELLRENGLNEESPAADEAFDDEEEEAVDDDIPEELSLAEVDGANAVPEKAVEKLLKNLQAIAKKQSKKTRKHKKGRKHRKGTKETKRRKHRKGTKERKNRKGTQGRKHRKGTKGRKHRKGTKNGKGRKHRKGAKNRKGRKNRKGGKTKRRRSPSRRYSRPFRGGPKVFYRKNPYATRRYNRPFRGGPNRFNPLPFRRPSPPTIHQTMQQLKAAVFQLTNVISRALATHDVKGRASLGKLRRYLMRAKLPASSPKCQRFIRKLKKKIAFWKARTANAGPSTLAIFQEVSKHMSAAEDRMSRRLDQELRERQQQLDSEQARLMAKAF